MVVSTPLLADDTRKPAFPKEHRDHVSEVEWMRRGNATGIIPNSHEGEIGVGFLTRLLRPLPLVLRPPSLVFLLPDQKAWRFPCMLK